MKIFRLLFLIPLITQCTSNFDPEFQGKTIYHSWSSDKIQLNLNGEIKEIKLPTTDTTVFNNPVWLKGQDRFLMTTSEKRQNCYTHAIVSFDMSGKLIDTVFTPAPCTINYFMPSPDDKSLLIRSYVYNDWKTTNTGTVSYFVYDLKQKTILDSIAFEKSRLNLEGFRETIWSPDSKQVIIFRSHRNNEQTAFIYDLNKTSVLLDTGSNFVWSPTNKEVVSYIKKNKILFKNLATNKTEEFFSGDKNIIINDFRWDPKGEYLIVNLINYFTNAETGGTRKPSSIFISVSDKQQSGKFPKHTVYHSWK
jgi:hypothetical protein